MRTPKGLVALLTVGLLVGPMAANAASVTYAFTGVVSYVTGAPGTAVGNAVFGLFTYDPTNYVPGGVTLSSQGFRHRNLESFAFVAAHQSQPGEKTE